MNNKIRVYRIQKGLSQENMAYELGISQKSYSNLENGKTKLKVETIYKIAVILEISPKLICPFSENCIHIENKN